jgi:hypothetical protein
MGAWCARVVRCACGCVRADVGARACMGVRTSMCACGRVFVSMRIVPRSFNLISFSFAVGIK